MALQLSYTAITGVTHSEAYAKVSATSIRKVYSESGDHFLVKYVVDIYACEDCKESKATGTQSFQMTITSEEWTNTILEHSYNHLKTQEGFTEAIDV